jgi:hypothetical protein
MNEHHKRPRFSEKSFGDPPRISTRNNFGEEEVRAPFWILVEPGISFRDFFCNSHARSGVSLPGFFVGTRAHKVLFFLGSFGATLSCVVGFCLDFLLGAREDKLTFFLDFFGAVRARTRVSFPYFFCSIRACPVISCPDFFDGRHAFLGAFFLGLAGSVGVYIVKVFRGSFGDKA